MKELRELERRIRLLECLHLALVTLCISLIMTIFVGEKNEPVRLLMAIGAIIPAQIIRFICDRVEKLFPKVILSLAVTGAAMAATFWNNYSGCYLACCIPILISGLLLPRHRNRQILMIPTLIALIPNFLIYVLGKVLQKPMLCSVSAVLAALITLNYFLYMNQTRLLDNIGTAVIALKATVSVSGLIRQNRKVVAGFLLAAILLIASVPILIGILGTEKTVEPREETVSVALPSPTPTPEPEGMKDYRKSEQAEPINAEFLLSLPYALAFFIMLGFAAGFVAFIFVIISYIIGQKDGPLDVEDGMTIERLKLEDASNGKERLSGYEKKIRRGYEKLIKHRAHEKAKLAVMTPTELEKAADVSGDGADTIHDVYMRTRYSGEPATKEGYAAFKEAVRALPDVSKDEPKA